MKAIYLSPLSCEDENTEEVQPQSGILIIDKTINSDEIQPSSGSLNSDEIQSSDGSLNSDEVQPLVGSVASVDSDIQVGFMRLALEEARLAYSESEVPIGAVVVCGGQVVAAAHNEREATSDPTAHAEVLALRRAGLVLKRWNLHDCELYVTIEPCAMCSGAIINSRVRTVYYGATDPRFGCGGSLMNLITDTRFNHRAEVVSGICEDEARALMQSFFKERRIK